MKIEKTDVVNTKQIWEQPKISEIKKETILGKARAGFDAQIEHS